MVLTVVIVIVMLVIAGGLVALYREVGLGSFEPADAQRTEAGPSGSAWPLGNLTVGNHVAVPSEAPFTGFLALVADDEEKF